MLLWFGDERGYNATNNPFSSKITSCGLVMKEDITQRHIIRNANVIGCGLVMKEDITQQLHLHTNLQEVVVW